MAIPQYLGELTEAHDVMKCMLCGMIPIGKKNSGLKYEKRVVPLMKMCPVLFPILISSSNVFSSRTPTNHKCVAFYHFSGFTVTGGHADVYVFSRRNCMELRGLINSRVSKDIESNLFFVPSV